PRTPPLGAAGAPRASEPAATAPAPTAPALASRSRRLSPSPSWVSGVSSAISVPLLSSDRPPQGRRPAVPSMRRTPGREVSGPARQETFQESIVGLSIDRAKSSETRLILVPQRPEQRERPLDGPTLGIRVQRD